MLRWLLPCISKGGMWSGFQNSTFPLLLTTKFLNRPFAMIEC